MTKETKRAAKFLDKTVSYGGEMAKMNIDTRRKAIDLYLANSFHIYEATKEGDKTRTFMCVNPIEPALNARISKYEFDYAMTQREALSLEAPSMLNNRLAS